jgi:hypothetical protein
VAGVELAVMSQKMRNFATALQQQALPIKKELWQNPISSTM